MEKASGGMLDFLYPENTGIDAFQRYLHTHCGKLILRILAETYKFEILNIAANNCLACTVEHASIRAHSCFGYLYRNLETYDRCDRYLPEILANSQQDVNVLTRTREEIFNILKREGYDLSNLDNIQLTRLINKIKTHSMCQLRTEIKRQIDGRVSDE